MGVFVGPMVDHPGQGLIGSSPSTLTRQSPESDAADPPKTCNLRHTPPQNGNSFPQPLRGWNVRSTSALDEKTFSFRALRGWIASGSPLACELLLASVDTNHGENFPRLLMSPTQREERGGREDAIRRLEPASGNAGAGSGTPSNRGDAHPSEGGGRRGRTRPSIPRRQGEPLACSAPGAAPAQAGSDVLLAFARPRKA